jgi:carbonic anhydrase
MREIDAGGPVGRRDILKFAAVGMAAGGLAAAGLGGTARAASARPATPGEALAALKEGNARYISDPKLCSMGLEAQRAAGVEGQAPWATIVGCADSRKPPELIFGGLGLGELFVARNAGNLVDTATLGTVEYGSAVLGVPLIVVLGHTACGAVAAACKIVTENATFPGAIGPMVEPILPAAIATRGEAGNYVNNAAKESARRTAARLAASSTLLADLVAAGKLKIVPAIYALDTGEVSYL